MIRQFSLLYLFFTIFVVIGCQELEPNLGKAQSYFPDKALLLKGYVNKYFIHEISEDGFEKSTDIIYKKYTLIDENTLYMELYGAGFDLQKYEILKFENDEMKIEEQGVIFKYDTIISQSNSSSFINWNTDTVYNSQHSDFKPWSERKIEYTTHFKKDTTILNRPAKVFESNFKNTLIYFNDNSDTLITERLYENFYVKDFGHFGYYGKDKEGIYNMELIEQMSIPAFENKKSNKFNFVAHIDAKDRIDENPYFEICDDNEYIFDYYNSPENNAGIIGGKKSLWNFLEKDLHDELLFDESGYLTFRFIINCKGEAGYFTTNMTDSNFDVKSFNPKTVNHLLKILMRIDTWKPCMIKSEPSDAYFYITFILQDGKIIDILP